MPFLGKNHHTCHNLSATHTHISEHVNIPTWRLQDVMRNWNWMPAIVRAVILFCHWGSTNKHTGKLMSHGDMNVNKQGLTTCIGVMYIYISPDNMKDLIMIYIHNNELLWHLYLQDPSHVSLHREFVKLVPNHYILFIRMSGNIAETNKYSWQIIFQHYAYLAPRLHTWVRQLVPSASSAGCWKWKQTIWLK